MNRAGAREVAFVPGFMQRADVWRAVAERLPTRYRSTCLDPRAATFEGRLREIERATEPGAVLVGYSLGGRLALHAALRAPKRYSALVLVGASAGIEDESTRRKRRAADEELAGWIEAHPIAKVVARWERLPIFATQSSALRERQRRDRLRHDPRELAELLRTGGQGALEPVWDRLGEIACPTLAIAGERDPVYAAAAERLAGLIPAGRAILVQGVGHAPQLEAPERIAAVLGEFLHEHLGDCGGVGGDAQAGALRDG